MSRRVSISEESLDQPGPLRRSNRIITRRSSANSITDSKLTNGDSQVETPVVDSKKVTKADTENNPTPVRTRRASTSKLIDEEKKLLSTPNTPSRRSTRILSTSPKKNDTPIRRTRSTSVDMDTVVAEPLPARRSTRRRSSVDIEEPIKEENVIKTKPVTRRRRSSSVDEIEENTKTEKAKPKLPLEPIEEQEAELKENLSPVKKAQRVSTVEKEEDAELRKSEKIIKDIDEALDDKIDKPEPKSAVPERVSSRSIFSPITPQKTTTDPKSDKKITMSEERKKSPIIESFPREEKVGTAQTSENISEEEMNPNKRSSLKKKVLYNTTDDQIDNSSMSLQQKENVDISEESEPKKTKKRSEKNFQLIINEEEVLNEKEIEENRNKASSTIGKQTKAAEVPKNSSDSSEKDNNRASLSSPLEKDIQKNVLDSSGKKNKKGTCISSGSDGSFTFNLNMSLDKSEISQNGIANAEDEVFTSPGSNKENSISNKMASSIEKAKNDGSKYNLNVSRNKSINRSKLFEPMDVDDSPKIGKTAVGKKEDENVIGKHQEPNENSNVDGNEVDQNEEEKSLSESTKSYISLVEEQDSPQLNKSITDKEKSFSRINEESTEDVSESPILSTNTSRSIKKKETSISAGKEDSENSDLSINILDTDDEEIELQEKEETIQETTVTIPLKRSKRPRISDGTSKIIHKKLQSESGNNERVGSISEDCEETSYEEESRKGQKGKNNDESLISSSENDKNKSLYILDSEDDSEFEKDSILKTGENILKEKEGNIVEKSSRQNSPSKKHSVEMKDEDKKKTNVGRTSIGNSSESTQNKSSDNETEKRKSGISLRKEEETEEYTENSELEASKVQELDNNVDSEKKRKSSSRSSLKREKEEIVGTSNSKEESQIENKRKSHSSTGREREETVETPNKATPSKNKIKLDESISAKLDELVTKKLKEDNVPDSEDSDEDSDKSMSEDFEKSHLAADEEVEDEDEEPADFFDDMADEGEEDTPSEGSNDIIDEGESIHSTDIEELQSEDSYDSDDSFIVKDDDCLELLPGDEDDLESADDESDRRKKKTSRILKNYDSSDDESGSMRVSFSEKVTVITDKSSKSEGVSKDVKGADSVEKKRILPKKIAEKSPLKMVDDKSPSKAMEDSKSPLKVGGKSPLKVEGKSPLKVGGKSPLKVEGKSPLKVEAKSPLKEGGKPSLILEGKSPLKGIKTPKKLEKKVLDELRSKSPLKFEDDNPVEDVSPSDLSSKGKSLLKKGGVADTSKSREESSISPRKLASNIIPDIQVDLIDDDDDDDSCSDEINEDERSENSFKEKSTFEDQLRSIVEPEECSTPNSNNSNSTNSRKSGARTSSIIVHENVSIDEIQDGFLVEKLQQVVRVFCSGIKTSEGNVSMNVSLDYVGNPKPSTENSDEESLEGEQSAIKETTSKPEHGEEQSSESSDRKELKGKSPRISRLSLEKESSSAKKRRLSLKNSYGDASLDITEKKSRKSSETKTNQESEEQIASKPCNTPLNQSKVDLSTEKSSAKKKRRSNLTPRFSETKINETSEDESESKIVCNTSINQSKFDLSTEKASAKKKRKSNLTPRTSETKTNENSGEENESKIVANTSLNQDKSSAKKMRRSNLSPRTSQKIQPEQEENTNKKRKSFENIVRRSNQFEVENILEDGENENLIQLKEAKVSPKEIDEILRPDEKIQKKSKKQRLRKRNSCEVSAEVQSSKKAKKDTTESIENVTELASDEDISINTERSNSSRLSSKFKTQHSTPEFVISKKMKLIAMKCEELSADDLRHKLPAKSEIVDGKSKIKQKKLKRLQSDLKKNLLSSLKEDLVTDVKNRSRRMLKPTVVMNSSNWMVEEAVVEPSRSNLSKCTFNYKKFNAKDLKSQDVGKPSRNMVGGKLNLNQLDERDFKNKMIYDRRIKREDSASLLRKKGYFL